MANRYPLVLSSGALRELTSADALQLPGALNEAPAVALASATTVDIGAALANTINITGTTTITGLGTAPSGVFRRLVFSAAVTLTYNAVSLILPTSANITTAADDVAEFLSLGSGNWKCISYGRKNGQPLVGAADATKLPLAGGKMTGALNEATAVTLASATTTSIGGAASNTVNVSGTTTITSLGTGNDGDFRRVVFAGALTLTHNAVSLILPTGANITTATNDVAEFVSLGGSNWKCLNYSRNSGQPLVGAADATKMPLAGGTFTGQYVEKVGTAIASAATVNLSTATGNTVHITGVTTITAMTVVSGSAVKVIFDGALTLTNGAALILPTGANIVTAAGDTCFVIGDGTNARVLGYQRANGQPLALPIVSGSNGGSGVNNGSRTMTYGGNVTFAGAFNTTFNILGTTSVEFPTSGRLATRDINYSTPSTGYTFVLEDAGKGFVNPAGGGAVTWTIPANASVAYPIGTVITISVENGAGNVTVQLTSDTMRLAGTGVTGTKTITANGSANFVKISATGWLVSGVNVS